MLDSIYSFLDLNDSQQVFRNDLLLILTVISILGFELIAVWKILFDHVEAPVDTPDPKHSETADSEIQDPPIRTEPQAIGNFLSSLTYLTLFTGVVLIFPWAYEKGLHVWLAPTAFGLGCFYYRREMRAKCLALSLPVTPTSVELIALVAVTLATGASILLRWRNVPIAMNGDVATICMSGMDMWKQHLHPFRINGSFLPGLLDPLYGGGVLLTGDPFFGNRLYPLFCGMLCPIIWYRWVCLIGSKPLAWISLFIMLVSPFFQYYSRVPMGTSLWLMQLIFFYGLTRSLVAPGMKGPLLGGIALGLAQWDYYASRVLLGVALTALILSFVFMRSLARGTQLRVGLILAIGLLILSGFFWADIYSADQFNWALTPRFFDPDAVFDAQTLYIKFLGHLNMWFDATGNEARFMTLPCTPLQYGPFSGLAIIGMAMLLFSFWSPVYLILAATFMLGIASSLMSNGMPNGHRAMVATLPVLLAVGQGVFCLWRDFPDRSRMARFRRLLVTIFLAWGGILSLWNFHVSIWKDQATVHAQQYDEDLRAKRLMENMNHCDLIITRMASALDRFFTGMNHFTILNYNNWLPPNWAERKTAVSGTGHVHDLVGLPRSLSNYLKFTEFINPAGSAAGWEYITDDKMFLGDLQAACDWAEKGRISGTIMFPFSGKATLSSNGCILQVESPVGSATAENAGTFEVLRGLNRVTLFPKENGQSPPTYLRMVETVGDVEDHAIKPGQLYRVPSCGWLQENFNDPLIGEASRSRVSSVIAPTIFTHEIETENQLRRAPSVNATRFSTYPNLPSGEHTFTILMNGAHPIRVAVAGKALISESSREESIYDFRLKAESVNGKLLEIYLVDEANSAAISLEITGESGRREVPPYEWFSPYAKPQE